MVSADCSILHKWISSPITLFVPCIAAVMVIFRKNLENLNLAGSFIVSFLTAGIVAQIMNIGNDMNNIRSVDSKL